MQETENMQQPPGMMQPSAAAKEQKGMFHHHVEVDPNVVALSNEVNSVNRRLRVLEERYMNVRKKTQVTDQNMLSAGKRIASKVQVVNSDIEDMRRSLYDIEEKLKIILKELELCAKKADVEVLERYINLIEPLEFVTKAEINRLVEQALSQAETQLPGSQEPLRKV